MIELSKIFAVQWQGRSRVLAEDLPRSIRIRPRIGSDGRQENDLPFATFLERVRERIVTRSAEL